MTSATIGRWPERTQQEPVSSWGVGWLQRLCQPVHQMGLESCFVGQLSGPRETRAESLLRVWARVSPP